MKHVRDNVYEHDGVMVEAVSAGDTRCKRCPFYTECRNRGGLIGFSCTGIIGDRVFIKYEEPKVEKIKLADVSFKCAVLTPERSEILQRAAFAAGGEWADKSKVFSETDKLCLFCEKGELSTCDTTGFFVNYSLPEVTLQQALDLLATVEKPEPVFDIKLRDEVLFLYDEWDFCHFARLHGNHFRGTDRTLAKQMIKFAGNEALLGATDTPSGWWEARNGKPVWVTK